jgi:ADP-ribosylation factor GTPase-activating protein 1
MDKWKDTELEKMKVGGNKNAREFFDDQSDWDDSMSIQQKYNTKAAALYRDKIAALASGKDWDITTSSAQNYSSAKAPTQSHHSSSRSQTATALGTSKSYQDVGSAGSGYQNDAGSGGGGYQNFDSQDFRDQKQNFFSRMQEENLARPE